MRLYLSFDKPWLELKIDKRLIKIKLIKLIFFKLTLLKIIKLCVTNNHFICSFIKNLQEFKSCKPVGWEKPVAVPTFTSFHLINVIYLNHLF